MVYTINEILTVGTVVRIGHSAGYTNQSCNTVDVGIYTKNGSQLQNQGLYSTALGFQAGRSTHGESRAVIDKEKGINTPENQV